ncbi:MAG: HAMP domain-containing protein, partial [Candidatus Methylomirabilales bacterium]
MGLFTSLKAKFITATILILVAAIGVSSWRTLKMQRDQLIAATEEKVTMLTDTIERSIATAMVEGRSEDVQAIVQKLGDHGDIQRIRIFDDEGTIRISSDLKERGRKVSRPGPPQYKGHIETNVPFIFKEHASGHAIHSLVKPILNRPECYRCHDPRHRVNGILQIDFSLAKARAQIASIHSFVLFSAIATIASLSLALWILLSRLVSRPVSALIRTMGEAEGGDLDARARVGSKDELG